MARARWGCTGVATRGVNCAKRPGTIRTAHLAQSRFRPLRQVDEHNRVLSFANPHFALQVSVSKRDPCGMFLEMSVGIDGTVRSPESGSLMVDRDAIRSLRQAGPAAGCDRARVDACRRRRVSSPLFANLPTRQQSARDRFVRWVISDSAAGNVGIPILSCRTSGASARMLIAKTPSSRRQS
jgi:hypothetical protein